MKFFTVTQMKKTARNLYFRREQLIISTWKSCELLIIAFFLLFQMINGRALFSPLWRLCWPPVPRTVMPILPPPLNFRKGQVYVNQCRTCKEKYLIKIKHLIYISFETGFLFCSLPVTENTLRITQTILIPSTVRGRHSKGMGDSASEIAKGSNSRFAPLVSPSFPFERLPLRLHANLLMQRRRNWVTLQVSY